MKEKEPKERLQEFLSQTSEFDYKAFEEQVRNNPALHGLLRNFDKMCRHASPYDREIMWNQLHTALQKRRHRRLWIRSVAAAVLILPLGLSLIFRDVKHQQIPGRILAVEKQESRQVQLYLAEGEVVDLTTLGNDTLILENGTGIQVNALSGLTYLHKQTKEETPVYHTLKVPRGCEYHLVLADATEVWLNSESELRFPASFVSGERRLQLKGEAYFKVAKDTLRPFRVMADEMLVEVLGTTFNVNAYRDNGALRTTLVEGSVKVKDTLSGYHCLLKPHQQAELQHGQGVVSEVRLDEVINWKEGQFLFREMPLEQIAKQLERWYDVQITFREDNLRKQHFTGIIKRYNTLAEVCAGIEETGEVRFEINGNRIMVCPIK